MLNIQRQNERWGGGGGEKRGSWLFFLTLAFVFICDILTQLTLVTHTWNTLSSRDDRQPFSNYVPNLEPKSLSKRELKAWRREIFRALLCIFFLKKKKKKGKKTLEKHGPLIVLLVILSLHYRLLMIGLRFSARLLELRKYFDERIYTRIHH